MSTTSNIVIFSLLTLCRVTTLIETDIYAPCFPDIIQYFNINEAKVQNLVSYNFFGLFIGCLIYGALSDTYGRKRTLVMGNMIFMIASLGCILSDNFESLCLLRFIQGIGASAILPIGSAIFFDTFNDKTAAKYVGITNFILGISMACAPILGNVLTLYYSWKATFILVFILTIFSLIGLIFFLNESICLKHEKTFNISIVFFNYIKLCTNIQFIFNTIVVCILISSLIIYTVNLPIIFINYLKIDSRIYSYFQGSILASFALASILSSKIIFYFNTRIICNFSIIGICIIFLLLYIFSTFFDKSTGWLTFIMCIATFIIAISMNAFSIIIMSIFPKDKGASGAIVSATRMILTAVSIILTTKYFNGTMKIMFQILFINVLCGAVLYLIAYLNSKAFEEQT